MSNGISEIREPENEFYNSYAPNTEEKRKLKQELNRMKKDYLEIPAIIGGEEVRTGDTEEIVIPHNHEERLGEVHMCGEEEVKKAIKKSQEAKEEWENLPWEERASVFLKAADLITDPYRYKMTASTMLGQSKTPHQAEIEAVGELADFLRFNAYYLQQIYRRQPDSAEGMWNRMEYRPLEGFVFAVTPFNFTAIAGNLPLAPALCGNVSLWKPATSSVYSSYYIMKVLEEAGMPEGVINFLPGSGSDVGRPAIESKHLAGLHFTGSTETFNRLQKQIAENIEKYNSYPRIVGETGGKDFIFAHKSADIDALVVAAIRGSYEYQGQKCSASSRMYVPKSIWPEFRTKFLAELRDVKHGDVEDFTNFMGAVIDQKAFDSISSYIDHAKNSDDAEILYGGSYDDSKGYFVEPTLIKAKKPRYKTMKEEIFGPVLTVYVYEDDQFEETLEVCDNTSPYGLTGAIFGKDREVLKKMKDKLDQAAGNFYINDKPTAAIVNQQPFGGARKSGTNDKAGSAANLMRWMSVRSIKETTVPPKDWKYPYMEEE